MSRLGLFILFSALSYSHSFYAQFFSQVANLVNVDFAYQGGEYGGGASFYDWNHDGWDDLTFCQNNGVFHFYQNTGGTFELIPPFIPNLGEAKMLNWVDYDNDGDSDIFVTYYEGPFKLYNNNGQFVFSDVTIASGFAVTSHKSGGQNWADYDRDGDMDVYISNYDAPFIGDPNTRNFLYRNNGNGTFTECSVDVGVDNGFNYTFCATWMDYNRDMWPDLFVINDRSESENYLYHNNGNGTFTDITVAAGLDFNIFSMSNSPEDYDLDGDLDIYISNGVAGNLLHRNNGNGTFSEAAVQSGAQLNIFSWSAQWLDANCDMYPDLHVAATPFWNSQGQNNFLLNLGDGNFMHNNNIAGIVGDLGWSHCSVTGDYNRDGRIDIAIVNDAPGKSVIWKGNPNNNHWITVTLEGVESGIDGYASWIDVFVGEQQLSRYTMNGEGYFSQNSQREHFGLDTHTIIDSIRISWISGNVDTWYNIPADQHLKLKEGEGFIPSIVSSSNEVCGGQTATISASEGYNYLWSTGVATSSIVVEEPNEYSVTYIDPYLNVFLSDTLEIVPFAFPDLGYQFYEGTCTSPAMFVYPMNFEYFVFPDPSYTDAFGMAWHVINDSGELTLTVQNEQGCSISESWQWDVYSPMHIVESIQYSTCHDGFSSIELNVIGGNPSYTIDWQGVNPMQLSEGWYTVQVTDEAGCGITEDFEIVHPSALTMEVSVEDPLCFGEYGSVLAVAEGGTGNIEISLSEGNFDQLQGGEYIVAATDELGCAVSQFITINEPELLDFSLTTTDFFEDGEAGSAAITINGGTAPYDIIWSSGGVDLSVTDLLPGTYSVVVTDANGCSVEGFFEIAFVMSVDALSHPLFVYYKPNSSTLVISANSDVVGDHWGIFNAQGQLIQSGVISYSKQEIPVNDLPSGVYLFSAMGVVSESLRWIKIN